MLPRLILMDLDDTLISYSHGIDHQDCWRRACLAHLPHGLHGNADQLVTAIRKHAAWYWSDSERHRAGRLDLPAARTVIVRQALEQEGVECSDASAYAIQHAFDEHRSSYIALDPDAVATLRLIRELGIGLILMTNGASAPQRAKIERFGLTDAFDDILIEGEYGVGKPDPAVYRHALSLMDVAAADTWMVGDNYEWEIAAPSRLGIRGIWVNPEGAPLPVTAALTPQLQPYLTIRSIGALAEALRYHADSD